MKVLPENIQLLNLLDGNFNYHYLLLVRLIDHFKHKRIDKNDIEKYFGTNSGIGDFLIANFDLIDRSYFSINCLLYFNVTIFTVEKLRKKYRSLEEIQRDSDFNRNGAIHAVTVNSINKAIGICLGKREITLKESIVNYIKSHEPCQNSELKEYFLNRNANICMEDLDRTLDTLIKDNLILLSVEGYRIPLISIESYIEGKFSDLDIALKELLDGRELSRIAYLNHKTIKEIVDLLHAYISSFPIFANEAKTNNLLSVYELTNGDLQIIGISTKIARYVRFKYILNPTKNAVDFVTDHSLINHSAGTKILTNHKIPVCHGKIVKNDFYSLFKEYCDHNNIMSFNLNTVKKEYNTFIKNLNFYDVKNVICKETFDKYYRQLFLSNDFICVKKDRFLVYKPEEYSSDFVENLHEFLKSYNGYGTLLNFYTTYESLCNQCGINDENDLFALAKRIFEEELKDLIIFVRNPVLMTAGINKEKFFEDFIFDLEMPFSEDAYYDYVVSKTGLKKNTVHLLTYKMLQNFKNKDGLISLDEDLSKEEYEELKIVLNNENCIGFKYFKSLVEAKNLNPLFLNGNILRKIGYIKTDICIYKDMFSSKLDAVKDALKHSEMILSDLELNKIANSEFLYYRFYEAASECCCLKIGDNKFLNLVARGQCNLVKKFKKDFLVFCEDEKFYTLDTLLEDNLFINFLYEHKEYMDFLYSFNTRELLKSIISTTKQFKYIDARNSFIFSESDLSIKIIVSKIMEENSILLLSELQEILFNEYGLDNKLSNATLSEMGFYCPASSEKVYLNIDYFNLEMEEILNEDS